MTRVELYNFPLSPCGEKVRYALAEKAVRYEHRHVDLTKKENLKPEFLALNGRGLVPVLVVEGRPLTESAVINEFIDDLWPDPPLRPASAYERARMRLWTKTVDERLHPAWPGIAWPILVRPRWLEKPAQEIEGMLEALLDPARRAKQERLYREELNAPDAMESLATVACICDQAERQLLKHPWLAGDTFSLADIALLPYCFALDAFGMRALFEQGRPTLAEWYRRCYARPAYDGDIRSLYEPSVLAAAAHAGRDAWQQIRTRLPARVGPGTDQGRDSQARGRATLGEVDLIS